MRTRRRAFGPLPSSEERRFPSDRRLLAVAAGAALAVGLSGCPSGDTAPATNVTHHSATLHASASCDTHTGTGSGEWWFEYRPIGGSWKIARPKTNWICQRGGQEDVSLPPKKVSGLRPSTTYQFLLAGHSEGTKPPGPVDGTAEPWYCVTAEDYCDVSRSSVTPSTFRTDDPPGTR